ncbi:MULTISPECIES: hypothetical protein [unclassified Leeuwenhoekiella]|uniref:hypothetical protein n=1 Tax=unclassified Leeuwenhoekiella TaxID=2615029 RepID=UPI000C5DD8F8|nr:MULTISPECIES: hypothetical protein [unclassified Leeuwenhoekiella]MAW94477.1 hypothetical protein [Leeuwenhoekiella sp.]MAW96973.1 hypothetical protein [Leeuwenhoekiella sp.]MBA81155.1 hypothetical protein [Leeuwenhoekiella sp.]|tara:strand:- start:15764 stop:16402 length:639 start_codon:yes stop_codon:yes gene_type:complete
METKNYLQDISEIKNMMSRSSRFMSLSGLSGILAGIYALAAAGYAHFRLAAMPTYTGDSLILGKLADFIATYDLVEDLMLTAFITLLLAIVTGAFLTWRKAKRLHEKIWNPVSKRLLANFGFPLITGGLFCGVLIQYGIVGLIAPATLIFYGLALINASKFTVGDIKYLGVANVLIGLIATQFVGYGLYFWALGFGVFHIIYGAIMYRKYDR